jgi:hypothetical protein
MKFSEVYVSFELRLFQLLAPSRTQALELNRFDRQLGPEQEKRSIAA